jgi:predicted phage tail protein
MLETIGSLGAALITSQLGAAELLLGLLVATGFVSIMAISLGTSLAILGLIARKGASSEKHLPPSLRRGSLVDEWRSHSSVDLA